MTKRVYMDWSVEQVCPGCGRTMRPKSGPPVPGLAMYGAFGHCVRCDRKIKKGKTDLSPSYWDGVSPCTGCSRQMVRQKSGSTGKPVHSSRGLCDRCFRRSMNGTPFDLKDRRDADNYVPQPCPSGCGRLIKPYGYPMHRRSCDGPSGAVGVPSEVSLYYVSPDTYGTSAEYRIKPDKDSVYIYALTDSKNRVKYVGKTVKSLESRLYGHYADSLREGRTYKMAQWLRSEPEGVRIVLLGTYSRDLWEIWEKYWIAKLLATGTELKNIELGGNQGKRIKYG